MKIRTWGCRGSIATPEKEKLHYGGNTTCVEVLLEDGTMVIFDAGTGIRNLGNSLLKRKEIKEVYLIITHAHWDHLTGFPFFVPAYIPGFKINVRGGPKAKKFLHDYLSEQMQPPFFPVDMSEMKADFNFTEGKPDILRIGSSEIIPIPLNHPNGGYGFRINDSKKSFVFLTDNELGMEYPGGLNKSDYAEFCKGANLIFHDAQYTEAEYVRKKTWGHSTFSQALQLGKSSGAKNLGFIHHDPERSDTELDTIIGSMKAKVKQEELRISCFGVKENVVVIL